MASSPKLPILLFLLGCYISLTSGQLNGCDSNPCQNNAVCVDGLIPYYTCQCTGPWHGRNCETRFGDIDIPNNFANEICEYEGGVGNVYNFVETINLPGPLPRRLECASLIRLHGALTVNFTFTYFDFEPNNKDTLSFNQGAFSYVNDTENWTYYGGKEPQNFTTYSFTYDISTDDSAPYFYLEVNTDRTVASGGFTLEISADGDDCLSSPCLNGATCNDLIRDYYCTCAMGYEGANCSIDTDECRSDPCVNGVCVDGIDSFTCNCNPGWAGVICDVGVVISNTAVSVSSGDILEGTQQTLTLDIILTSVANTGSVTGSGLLDVTSFLSVNSDGSGTRYETSTTTASSGDHGFTGITAGTTADISNLAAAIDLRNGPTCSQFRYVCVEIQRGSSPSVDYMLSGETTSSLIGCQEITCRGVVISNTAVSVSSGAVLEGTQQTLTLDITLTSVADTGSVTGSGLLDVTSFLSVNSDGSGTRYETSTTTASSGNHGFAGITAGTTADISNLAAAIDLRNGPTCSQFSYVCVEIQRGSSPSIDYMLSGQTAGSLIGCQIITCRGVVISNTAVAVSSGDVLEGTQQTLTLDITLASVADTGSVTGSGLLDVTSFLSVNSDGSGIRYETSTTTASSGNHGFTGITAGTTVDISNLAAAIDLRNGPTCSQFRYACVEIQRGSSPSIDYMLSGQAAGSLIGCQIITCRGVEISNTALNVLSGDISEGESQTLRLDITLSSVAGAGSVSGTGLIDVLSFLSATSDGSGTRYDTTTTTVSNVHGFTGIIAGASTGISNINAGIDLQDGPTCSDFSYVCVEIRRGLSPSINYMLSGSQPESLIGCQLITCRGVEITRTAVTVQSGGIREGASQSIVFDIELSSIAEAGSVSGTDLWQISQFLSSTNDSSGNVRNFPIAGLTSFQSNMPLVAGSPTNINGINITVDLSNGPTCSEFDYFCVTIEMNPMADPQFSLRGVPGPDSLIGCQAIACRGVEISMTNVGGIGGELIEGILSTLTFDVALQTRAVGGDVSGTNLWQVNAFGSSNSDGSGTRYLSILADLPAAAAAEGVVAGDVASLQGLTAEFMLSSSVTCAQFQYICVQVDRNINSNPSFTLTGWPNSSSLIGCTQTSCGGVEITNTDLVILSGYLREGVPSNMISFDVTLTSNPDAGSVSGTGLWDIMAWISASSSGEAPRYQEDIVNLTPQQSATPIVSGVDTARIQGLEVNWDSAANGPLCSQAGYMCVRVQKGAAANPDFRVTGSPNDAVFTDCKPLTCRAVEVTGTTLDLSSTSILEGAVQTLPFTYTIHTDPQGGGVEGDNLWDLFLFFSDSALGSNILNEQAISLTPTQTDSPVVPGVDTLIAGLSAPLNLQGGPTCSQFSHVCVRLAKSGGANPDFGVSGIPDDTAYVDCIEVTCTGVLITGTNLVLNSGDIQEGTVQQVQFDINLDSDPTGGSITGNDLWTVTVFGSLSADGVGASVDEQTVFLTQTQGATAIAAGTRATIQGIEFTWDLTNGPLCSEFDYLCAQVEKNQLSSLDFALSGIPDDDTLTSCISITCRGVDITQTTVTVPDSEILEGTAQNVDLTITLESNNMGGSVNGDFLWDVVGFLSADANGAGTRFAEAQIALSEDQAGLDITAGVAVQLSPITYLLDITDGATCSQFQYLCVEVRQGSSPAPAFQLDSTPEDLTDCMPVTCRGVEITSTSINLESNVVVEGVVNQQLFVDIVLQSNGLAGSVSGTNLWDFEVYGSMNPDGSGNRVGQTVTPLNVHLDNPLEAGIPTEFDNIEVTWDMNAGDTCADVQYICVDVLKNTAANPDFTLTVLNSNALRACQPLNCRGVEVTGIQLVVESGGVLVERDPSHPVTFDIEIDSNAEGGSVSSGTNLWLTRVYASDSGTPGGSVINQPIDVALTPMQSGTGIIAGTTALIESVNANLNLNGALCSELGGICVVLQRNPASTPTFTFDPQPNSNVLTSCVPASCTGVQITDVNFDVISGAPIQAGSENNDLTFDLNINTNVDGASLAGDNLWQVELFLNSQMDGQGITTSSQQTSIPAASNGQPLIAGVSYTLEDISTVLDLRNMECSSLPFICLRLSKNPNSNPDFTLEANDADLVSCQALPCTDTNECDPNPCENGGLCTDGVNSYSCACPAGFTGTNCEMDIDECSSMPCQNGGTCMEGVDRFDCTCAPGYTGTFCTEDINECNSFPCENGGVCDNLLAAYSCDCQPGFEGVNCQINIDECASMPCENSGTCEDLVNGYLCNCIDGYAGTNCEMNINECQSFPCLNGATCMDEIADYLCMCAVGWTGRNCDIEINECLSDPCQFGQCDHGIGFYFCTCDPGYTGTNCDFDIDECASGPCSNGGTCMDEINGYTCTCAPGWTSTTCNIDINECTETVNPCNGNGVCNNLENRFECDCFPGWTGATCAIDINECESSPCENGGTCNDEINMFTCDCADGFTGVTCNIEINECTSQPCQNGGTCQDGDNSFNCLCVNGWQGETCTEDVNECASMPCENNGTCTHGVNIYFCECTQAWSGYRCEVEFLECSSNPCLNEGSCIEQVNGYVCACQPGYTGTHCEIDINECASDPCQNGGECTDGINSYTCDCQAGYNGLVCQFDINECASDPCQNGGTCNDEIASYTCECQPGYTGTECQIDYNECSSFPCANGGTCSHSINAYTCACLPGWTGTNCEINIDECSSSPCRNRGTCTDAVNFYVCSCMPGFEGTNCELEIDECESSPCLNGGTCLDNINSFSCRCVSGYAGLTCEQDIDECASSPCLFGGTCRDLVNAFECDCPSGREGVRCELDTNECASTPCQNGGQCNDLFDAYSCSCAAGYGGTNCQIDIDECASSPCLNGGQCSHGIDIFFCDCLDGYEGLRCDININECASNPCLNGGQCLDDINSYTCDCADGWEGARCELNIDECDPNPCVNGACSDGVFAFTCYCDPGWTGDLCNDEINECESDPCQNGGTCVDAINSYSCQCLPGWTGYNCQSDINECSSNPCQNRAQCNNLQNAYSCTCADGWTGTNCDIDIDECEQGPCQNSGTCNNLQNGYTCTCTAAWTGPNCDINVDECASNPCQNGGTCNDMINRYTCSCSGGYTGVHCEISINECLSNPCVNGICVDEVNSFRCACDAGWTGEFCNINIDDCLVDSCLNGGTCVDGVNTFRCSCLPGWTGNRCEFDIDECASQPCQNGAVCNNLLNMFTCTCPTGFTGVFCEIDIDECSSAPCLNGGLCFNNPDKLTYRCACMPGYTGDRCQINIDECASNPCVNGGTCQDGINQFECLCPPGYAGPTCLINIDDCFNGPCLNGGICLDMIEGYQCTCPQGYTGPNCEINLNECSSNPCRNGAICVNRIDEHGYDCQCVPGFTGTHCEININDCAQSPCMNNGICIDGINSFTCTCSQGWTGMRCEIAVGCRVNYTLDVGGKVIINSPNYPSNYGNGENCLWFIMGINGREVTIDFKDFYTENRYDNFRIGVGSDPNFGSLRLGASGPVTPDDTVIQANSLWITFQTDNEKTDRGFSVEFRDSEYQVLTPCDAQPCINGGTCSDVGTIQFQCQCTPFWTGSYCEVPSEMNKCGLNPCTNGAECMNMGTDYICACPPGFTGKNCTEDIDECAQNPCQNGGQCRNLIDSFVCICQSCYSGRFCEVEPTSVECSQNLCENAGDCSFTSGVYQCTCEDGYDGAYCEVDADKCRFNPCAFGTCVTMGNDYQCLCDPGYMGMRCDIEDTTSCVNANPCQNGAGCTVMNGTYTCNCPAGFGGDYCAENIDDCMNETCNGNGVCEDGIDGFTCVCQSGFMGDLCQIDIDECSSNPCQNNGVCVNNENSFSCVCSSNFIQPVCTPVLVTTGAQVQNTFRGVRIGLDPYFILLIVALALFAIFFLLLFLIANCCRTKADLYDTEKARLGDYPSQTRPELSILGNAEPPGTRENDYALHGPIPPGGGGVSALNSYENPWPQSNDELQKTQL